MGPYAPNPLTPNMLAGLQALGRGDVRGGTQPTRQRLEKLGLVEFFSDPVTCKTWDPRTSPWHERPLRLTEKGRQVLADHLRAYPGPTKVLKVGARVWTRTWTDHGPGIADATISNVSKTHYTIDGGPVPGTAGDRYRYYVQIADLKDTEPGIRYLDGRGRGAKLYLDESVMWIDLNRSRIIEAIEYGDVGLLKRIDRLLAKSRDLADRKTPQRPRRQLLTRRVRHKKKGTA